ncbi:Tripartite ATP-independent periplasmic transporter DctQ component [Leptothrix cholodnii SP-6]|uniref:TRAP transporter small permease protein n=1 Tax=Leptothrix cholodnii (strain ATCC 51168 / LMG 8142 / SP-6) TaxID=395495 RepID=B1Y3Y8_LEPCP|nr:TRAP transporter small permease [Leptothrix cholodnii]ACB33382.1 Tripartite ATP-independent periplasmic transporter DctQ component [Leptothrix cholodnii SP-6]
MDPLYIRLMDRFYLASIWLAGAAIFFMSLIIPWGVFTRYVLGTGSQWPEPIAILLMMVFTFIGAAAAYRANAHIAVTMLTDVLPAPLRKLSARVVDLLMLLACLFVTFYGARLCLETMGQSLAELPWLPVGVTYASLPIGAAVTILFVLERMFYGTQNHRPLVRYEEGDASDATDTPTTEGAR